MRSRLLVSGLPRSLPPLPGSPAPLCLPCVEGRQRAAPHSSSFPPTTAPLQTLHMDVWGPAPVSGTNQERYFLLVVDEFTRYTTVFPLRSKADVSGFYVCTLRDGEFSSSLLAEFSPDEGIRQTFTLPTSPQQNEIDEHCIGLIMEVARTSMIQAAAPHFLWPFADRYAAHQLKLWPRGALSLVRDTTASKISPRTLCCAFLGFTIDAPPWLFYYPRSRRVFSSQDVTFDELVCFYRLHPHASHPVPLAPLFLVPVPTPGRPPPPTGSCSLRCVSSRPTPLVEPLEVSSNSSSPAEGGDLAADDTAATRHSPRLKTTPGFPPRPSSPPLQRVAMDTGAAGGGDTRGEDVGGAGPGGAETGCAETGGAETGGTGDQSGITNGPLTTGSGDAETGDAASPSGGGAVGAPAAGPGVGQHQPPSRLETPSPQQLREWDVRRGRSGAGAWSSLDTGAAGAGGTAGGAGAAGAGGTACAGGIGAGGTGGHGGAGAVRSVGARTRGAGAAGAGGVGGAAGAGGTGAAGPGGDRTRGAGAARAGGAAGAGGTGAGDTGGPGGAGAAGPGGARTRGAGAAGAGGAAGAACGAAGAGAGGGATGGTGGTGGAGAADGMGTALSRPFFYPQLQSSLPPPDSALRQFLSLLSSTSLTPPLLCPPTNQSQQQLLPGSPLPALAPHTEVTESLTERREPKTHASTPDLAHHVARPRPPAVPGTHVMALRPSYVPQLVPLPSPPVSSLCDGSDPASDLARAASPNVTRLLATVVTDLDFESTAAFSLVTELVEFPARRRLDYAASLVSEQFELECLAAALPHFTSMILCPEGDPDAPKIPTLHSYAEVIAGEYSSHWQTAMDAEMASWKSTSTYVDEVPPRGANIVDGMWIFKVKRPPGSPPALKARYVARGSTQRQGVDYIQTFSPTPNLRRPVHGLRQAPCEWHDTLRTTLAALGFAPSSVDPSLFLRTDTSRSPFHVLVYVLQRFGFQYSSPLPTPLPTGHSISALPSDESVEPSGPYPELVGCLMYLMTCTRPDLAYPLSLLARYVSPGRHRKVHWDAAKRVLHYLCSISGMGLVLGGRCSVVLTGHSDASWADDWETQHSSQGYTFSLGFGSVSLRSTHSSSVLGSSCESEIYVGAVAEDNRMTRRMKVQGKINLN
ncbi:unnamed protein product [Closterium sp. NIES-53]